jgi:hypothetical protein
MMAAAAYKSQDGDNGDVLYCVVGLVGRGEETRLTEDTSEIADEKEANESLCTSTYYALKMVRFVPEIHSLDSVDGVHLPELVGR